MPKSDDPKLWPWKPASKLHVGSNFLLNGVTHIVLSTDQKYNGYLSVRRLDGEAFNLAVSLKVLYQVKTHTAKQQKGGNQCNR